MEVAKLQKILIVAVVLLSLLGGASAAQAAGLQIVLQPESVLWFEGKSTLHPFEVTATKVNTAIELAAGDTSLAGESTNAKIYQEITQGTKVKKFEVAIPVKSLQSGQSGLDKNMYGTLKADKYPTIQFHLLKYVPHPTKKKDVTLIIAIGRLVVAGKEKSLELAAHAYGAEDGIRVVGSKELLMSDFGVDPPRMMFGALRTDDNITVHFDLRFGIEKPKKGGD